MDPKKTGAYLALLRKSRGWTQQETADRLGVSNKTVSKWESGGGFPDISVLPALAEMYGVTVDELLAGEAAPDPKGPSQVERYLSQRGDLRFRLGLAAAVLCVVAARLYLLFLWDIAMGILLLLGSFLAVWVGFSVCSPQILGKRLRLLLPLAAAQTWLAAWYLWTLPVAQAFHVFSRMPKENYTFIWGMLRNLATWTGAMLLVPLVYAGLRALLRRRGGGSLLPRREFGVAVAGWGPCCAGRRPGGSGNGLWRWPMPP